MKRHTLILLVAAVTAFVIWRRRQIADVLGLYHPLAVDPTTGKTVLH